MARKSRKRTKRTARSARPARTARGLSAISLSDLRAELQRRQRAATPLLRRRERLVAQLEEIDSKLEEHGISAGDTPTTAAPRARAAASAPAARKLRKKTRKAKAAGGRRGPRGGNAMKLVDALQEVLKGTQMAVKDVVVAVQKAGYKTGSPNFRTIVNQALTANPDRFKKVKRGTYTAK